LFGGELLERLLGLFEVGDVGLGFCQIAIELREFVGRAAGACVSQIRLRRQQIRAGLRELRVNVGSIQRENQLPAMNGLAFGSGDFFDECGEFGVGDRRRNRLNLAITLNRGA
jgi:hypothetical protein